MIHLLLVEDDFLIATLQIRQLKDYGYSITHVNSGEKAIELFEKENDIDLVLMDINLQNTLDGTDTAEIILKDHDVPIVFLSSHIEKEIVEKTERITNYGYIVKNTGIVVLDTGIKMALKLFTATQELLIINKRFEKARDISHIGSWEYDTKNQTFWGDEAARKIYGFDLKDEVFSAEKVMGCVPDRTYVDQALIDLLAGGKPYNIKFDIVTYTTRERRTIHSIAEMDAGGKVLGVLRDITNERSVEQELKVRNSTLNAVLEHAPIGIALVGEDGTVLKYNKRLLGILHMSEEDFDSKKYQKRAYIRTDGSLKSCGEFPSRRAILENKVIEPVEIGVVLEDEELIWLNVSAAPMGDGTCIVLTNDITVKMKALSL
jgi:CheY-like chemotaxis protein